MKQTPAPARLHLKLYGTVQGVGFRAFTRHLAGRHHLTGYVRNCPDGAVELEAIGDPADIAGFRAAVTRGPPYATVQRIEELPATDEDPGSSFVIRH